MAYFFIFFCNDLIFSTVLLIDTKLLQNMIDNSVHNLYN